MAFNIISGIRGLYTTAMGIMLPNQIGTQLATGGPTQYMGSQADLAVGAATVNSSIFSAGSPVESAKALVWCKASTATGNVEVRLQASSSATFASDVVTIDTKTQVVAVTGILLSFKLDGCLSDVARQFFRVQIANTAGALTVDLIVTAI